MKKIFMVLAFFVVFAGVSFGAESQDRAFEFMSADDFTPMGLYSRFSVSCGEICEMVPTEPPAAVIGVSADERGVFILVEGRIYMLHAGNPPMN